jgi:hypothetical protein
MQRLSATKSFFIGAVVLFGYLWIALFGLLPSSPVPHIFSKSNCPYSVGQHSICPMDTMHHLQEWQEYSNIVIPLFKVLILALCVAAASIIWKTLSPIFLYTKQRYKTPPISLYQNLFSRGILNPKLY